MIDSGASACWNFWHEEGRNFVALITSKEAIERLRKLTETSEFRTLMPIFNGLVQLDISSPEVPRV
jgi:hypothetical protein